MRIEFFVCTYTLHIRKFLGKFFSRENSTRWDEFVVVSRLKLSPRHFLRTQIRSGSSINSLTETLNDTLEGWVPTEDYFDPPLKGIWYLFFSSHQVNSKNCGPVLLFKTTFCY